MALISAESLERVKQTADIVEVISAHTDLRRQGARWVGLCPFHEERTPVVLGRRPGEALPLLRLRGRRRRDQVRRGEGGARLRRGGGAARRPLRGRAGAREGGPAGGGAAPAAPPARGAARPHRLLLRRLPLGVERGREGARVPGRAGAGRGGAARASGSATRRAPGTRCWSAGSGPGSRSTSCAASGWSSAGGGEASTTASAPGSCSRSATAAAGCWASAAGRCAPTRAPSTSTRRRPTSSTRARCSTASTWPRPRSPRRGARWWSRATPTCSRCTRPGSRRRSG